MPKFDYLFFDTREKADLQTILHTFVFMHCRFSKGTMTIKQPSNRD